MPTRQTASRYQNLDLLRIISMFLIVLVHTVTHTNILDVILAQKWSIAKFYIYAVYSLAHICVNCYVLLSGYFLITSRFKLSKLFTIWLETVFYSLLFKAVFMCSGEIPFSPVSLISCFLPFTTGRYWFITIYFGMYLLSPFLNATIRALDRKKHALLNVVFFILMSVLTSMGNMVNGMSSGNGYGLAWFIVLYFVGAWLRLYYRPDFKSFRKFLAFLCVPVLMAVALFLAEKTQISYLRSTVLSWLSYNSVPVYVASLLFFCVFLNIQDFRYKFFAKLISFLSPLTLGVYLIHEHPNIRLWLWDHVPLAQYTQDPIFPLMQLGITLTVFCICIFLEKIRTSLFLPIERSPKIHSICENATTRALSLLAKFIP